MEAFDQLEACRICVTCYPISEMDFVNLFEKNADFQRELDFIQAEIKTWQLKIAPDDGLPQRICANCFAKFCSIDSFRQECAEAQDKLMLSVVSMQCGNEIQVATEQEQPAIALTSGYLAEGGEEQIKDEPVQQEQIVIAAPAPATAQTEAALTDYTVYEQNFGHFDNPSLIDQSATLLDNQLMPSDVANGLQLVPPQDVYFETPETSSVAEPTAEADSPVLACVLPAKEADNLDGQDLEEMLQGSIIPTKSSGKYKMRLESRSEQLENNNHIEMGNAAQRATSPTSLVARRHKEDFRVGANNYQSQYDREEMASDTDCDETESSPSPRLLGKAFACHYCYCPEQGSVDHLIFPNDDALSQHFFDEHDPNRPYSCPQCTQTYKSQRLRDNHIRLMHYKPPPYTLECNFCHKRLRGPLEVHQYSCMYVDDWQCDQCNRKFLRTPLHRFRAHQRQHDPNKQFHCSICSRPFLRRANMEAHERQHTVHGATIYNCDDCSSSFTNEYELKRHRYQQHNGEMPVKCQYCQKGFVSKAFLNRHLHYLHPDKMEGNNADAVTCRNCNTTFSSVHKLRFHMQRPRDENGNCTETPYTLKEKRRRQRRQEIPVRCTEEGCDYIARSDTVLAYHVRDKHRLLQCEYCNEEYTRQQLISHLRNVHRAEIDVDLSTDASNVENTTMNTINSNGIAHDDDGSAAFGNDQQSDVFTMTSQTGESTPASNDEYLLQANGDFDQYFMGSLLDAEQEITVT